MDLQYIFIFFIFMVSRSVLSHKLLSGCGINSVKKGSTLGLTDFLFSLPPILVHRLCLCVIVNVCACIRMCVQVPMLAAQM